MIYPSNIKNLNASLVVYWSFVTSGLRAFSLDENTLCSKTNLFSYANYSFGLIWELIVFHLCFPKIEWSLVEEYIRIFSIFF